MAKPLAQITFDFVEAGEAENLQSITPAMAREAKSVAAVNEPVAVFKVKNKKPDAKIPHASAPGSVGVSVPETPVTMTDKFLSKRGRKSLKEIALTADLIQVPEDEILFQKQYYSIGEVAAMFRENQSLIRYWETEFDILEPRKNRKGDRFFRPVDIKNLLLIYDLLRRRKFTIEGAKEFLKKNKKAEEKFAAIQSLQKIKGFLLELKANL
jgi:DNA-binding transcriptional MerR regulator